MCGQATWNRPLTRTWQWRCRVGEGVVGDEPLADPICACRFTRCRCVPLTVCAARSTSMSIPADEVSSLIQEVASGAQLELGSAFADLGVATGPVSAPAAATAAPGTPPALLALLTASTPHC